MQLDEQDRAILQRRQALLDARTHIGEGDFLRFPGGTYRRVAHDWGDSVQPTVGTNSACAGDESFYLADGYASFSGALDSAIPRNQITPTRETREGAVWIFHHDYATAGGDVRVTARFRVFEVRVFSENDIAYIECNHPSRKDLAAAARRQDIAGFLALARDYTQALDIRITDLCDRIRGLADAPIRQGVPA